MRSSLPPFPFLTLLLPPPPPQSPSFLAARLSEPAELWMKWFGGSNPAAAMVTGLPARSTVRGRSSFPAPELQFPECRAPRALREIHLLDSVQSEPFNLGEDIYGHPQGNTAQTVGIWRGTESRDTSGGGPPDIHAGGQQLQEGTKARDVY